MPEIVTASRDARHPTGPNVDPVQPAGQQMVIWQTLSVAFRVVVRRSAGIIVD
ncbi:hypothetical protein [Micromonospora chokoriensis]|uniref:hypothetical protein n=1 Tax=Micromonospora chokoriensis TaxID=356851 RepID=UPI000A58A3DF|nr:hypothetical protein [Micromonospora chokoriensis]